MRGKLLRVLLLAALVLLLVPAIAGAATYADGGSGRQKIDNKPDPLTTARGVLKQRALQAKLAGKSAGKVKQVGKGQYVELAREGEGMVWTVLGEFADLKHNEIPEPNREVDNSTYWVPDFSKSYYDELLYDKTPGANSMANFYIENSSNRYTVAGESTDWISVPGNPSTTTTTLTPTCGRSWRIR